MKGKPEVLEILNSLLREEMTAISQYQLHSEMYKNMGYHELHEAVEKASVEEMKHVEDLAARALFLEGQPIISELEKLHVGHTVPEMLENDRALEQDAINRYNEAVAKVSALGDNGTKKLLDHILLEEEAHLDYFETQLSLIEQLSLPKYLLTQK